MFLNHQLIYLIQGGRLRLTKPDSLTHGPLAACLPLRVKQKRVLWRQLSSSQHCYFRAQIMTPKWDRKESPLSLVWHWPSKPHHQPQTSTTLLVVLGDRKGRPLAQFRLQVMTTCADQNVHEQGLHWYWHFAKHDLFSPVHQFWFNRPSVFRRTWSSLIV